MEIKILQVFYDKNGLPYKDKERTVHYPITSGTFLGASNTTQIRFYYDQLDELNESTFVAVSKLPNGKIGSEILESAFDEEINENYVTLSLSQFYTQYKGDVYISLQGYQGGVRVEQDENGIYSIIGTPTIQATGSIKLSIAYAPTFIGSGETENITLQRVLAELSTKLGIRQETLHVEELPTVGNPNVWYVVNDDPNDINKANIYIWNATTQTYVWVGDNTLDLGDYYTQEEGEQFEQEIRDTIGNGSPKGVYATLSDLQTAYPTGNSGIYIVAATGHWYYWNGSVWADGGQYLSSGLNDYDYISSSVLSLYGGDLKHNSQNALIDLTGQPSDNVETSRCSDFIRLKKGQCIRFYGAIGPTRAAIAIYSSPSYSNFTSAIAGQDAIHLTEYKYLAENDCFVICSSTDYYTQNNFDGTNYNVFDNKPLSLHIEYNTDNEWVSKYFTLLFDKKGLFFIKNSANFQSYVTFLKNNEEKTFVLLEANEEKTYFVNDYFDTIRVSSSSSGLTKISINEIGTEYSNSKTTENIVGEYLLCLNYTSAESFREDFNVSGTNGYYKITNNGNVDTYIDFYEENETDAFMYILIKSGETINANITANFVKIQVSGNAGRFSISINKNGIDDKLDYINESVKNNISYFAKKYEPELPFNNIMFVKKLYETLDGYPGLGYDIVYDETNSRYIMFRAVFDNLLNYAKVVMSYSNDLENWSADTDVLLPTGQEGDADKGSITFPQLLKYGNEYIMYYVGFDETGFERGKHSICYATSNDLTTWTRHGAILTVQNFINDGVWDISKLSTGVIYRPKVINLNGKYYMFINGGPDGDANIGGPDENIYLCESDNPKDNWKVIKEIINANDVYPNINYKICSDPDILTNGSNFVMAFWGSGGIKFAMARNCDFPTNWKLVDFNFSGVLRPLFVPTKDNLFFIVNDGDARSILLYKAYWK